MHENVRLLDLGWHQELAAAFAELQNDPTFLPARVTAASREHYRLLAAPPGATALTELDGEPSGRLRYRAESSADLPAVGDWVVAQAFPGESLAIVHHLLPRQGRLARRQAGGAAEVQILGANVDTILVLTSLNRDLNPKRLHRYLGLARQGGCRPAVVLSKADLVPEKETREKLHRGVRSGLGLPAAAESLEAAEDRVPIHLLSATTGEGLEALAPYLVRGETVALVGSSGVGKSTLANALLGTEHQATREIRAGDDRGRHGTTHRELLPLGEPPGRGGWLMDTPGLRELGLWTGDGDEDSLDGIFGDIAALAQSCRYADCRHDGEPGCTVAMALAEGRLGPERLESLRKLQREEEYLETRQAGAAAMAERRRKVAAVHRQARAFSRAKRRW